jgi:hypothetical protein
LNAPLSNAMLSANELHHHLIARSTAMRALCVRLCFPLLFSLLFPLFAHAATPVRIQLQPLSDGAFAVDYRFPQLITVFHFENPSPQRSSQWKSLDPNIVVTDSDVHSVDGKPFASAHFELRLNNSGIQRTYPIVARFGDGSGAVFTEHLRPSDAEFDAQFVFLPRAGESVTVRGITSKTPLAWQDDPRREDGGTRGAYVYFGPDLPVQSGAASMLIDPGMPAWPRAALQQSIAELIAYYTRLFGPLRGNPPSFLIYYSPGARNANYHGDVLPGSAVRLQLWGEWNPSQRAQLGMLRRFVAHELFHVWAQSTGFAGTAGQPWVHEGIAEYGAIRAMAGLAYLDDTEALDLISKDANRCSVGLMKHPLRAVDPHSGEQSQFYDCGVLMFYLIDHAAPALGQPGLLALLRARWREPGMDMVRLLAMLAATPGGRPVAQALTLMRDGPAAGASGFDIVPALSGAGVPFHAEGSRFDTEVYRDRVLSPVLDKLCTAYPRGYFGYPDRVEIDPAGHCEGFTDRTAIVAIDGVALSGDPARLYDAARAGCAGVGVIVLERADGRRTEVACPGPLPTLPPALKLTRLPSG